MCEICEWEACEQCETLEDYNANIVAHYREILERASHESVNWPWRASGKVE